MKEKIVGGQGTGPGGVYIVPAASLSAEDKSLLFAVSRVQLRADGPSLKAQLQVTDSRSSLCEPPLPITAPPNRYAAEAAAEVDDYLFYNGSGGFSLDGREYHIVLKNGNLLPAPWVNVMANPRFGCLTSELYTGYTWWRNSRECKLTPWSNDPVLDPPGEVCYMRDEESGEYWQTVPSRKHDTSTYKVSHGKGYSRYEHESHGLGQTMTVFVPLEDPIKVIKLRLKNKTSNTRRLSVTYYAEWVLGVNREGNSSFIVTEWDESERRPYGTQLVSGELPGCNGFLSCLSATGSTAGTIIYSFCRADMDRRSPGISRPQWQYRGASSDEPASPVWSNGADV